MGEFVGLTEELCDKAFEIVYPTIMNCMDCGEFSRRQGFLVVLEPTIPWEPKYKGPSDEMFNQDVVLTYWQWDDKRAFDAPFGVVAMAKAFASWKTGLPAQMIQQSAPYLYEPGWTKWGGSAVGDGGLVVAFSGVQAYYDQMISEMMLAAIKGVCLDAMHNKQTGVMQDPAITFLGQRDPQ